MSEVDAIALGLAERLSTIPDFEYRAYDTWPDAVNLPCVIVDGPTDNQDRAFGDGGGIFDYDLIIIVPIRSGIDKAQRDIRPYLARTGEASIQKALEAEQTLGGRVDTLIMRGGIRSLGDFEMNGSQCFGAVRSVGVYPPKA